ncbi:TylF/MycF family methyltransferase [Microvirga rosea]|uniref:TylF/MycF family methyltransferase n=1 Tax=Microvirga rosea TaxID=2715425 RepID=UPI001D0B927F|nr:TylF/MycF family methyltransferase [Microvirga rosea]MCB8823451.1 TylF/MycF family methyltransferase [Microvirga rosea]
MTDTFFYPSGGEETYYQKLASITERWPHEVRHYLDLFPVYASRRSFIRQLAHYELFKLTMELPGHYVDVGVYYGKSFFSWHKYLEVLTPTATHKKVIGFDSFAGFPKLAVEDGDADVSIQKSVGGLSSENFLEEFETLLALQNSDGVLPTGRGIVVKGDVCETLPKWLLDNPEARICLLNLDVDLYEPTKVALEEAWDRIVPGGVLILDEYGTSKWPGEAKAWDEFSRSRGITAPLKRFPWANAPGAYLIKP